jgi:hypothetical protein
VCSGATPPTYDHQHSGIAFELRHAVVRQCETRPAGRFNQDTVVVKKSLTGSDGALVRHGDASDGMRLRQPVGAYAWAEHDERIAQIRARKLKSIFSLMEGHPAYTPEVFAPLDPTNSNSASKLLSPPVSSPAVDGFLRFVAATVQRYQGDDVVCEIWNEPDLDHFWPPRASATAYIELATETCKTIPQSGAFGEGDWTWDCKSRY